MKHANKLLLILAVIVLIGFVVIACDNGNGDQNCSTCGKYPCQCSTNTTCETCEEEPCECPTDTTCETCEEEPCECPTDTTCETCEKEPCECPTDTCEQGHNFADNWQTTISSDWHNNTTDECGNGVETLTCTRCPETNGTRPIPCLGTQGLNISDGRTSGYGLSVEAVCIPDNVATIIMVQAFFGNTNIKSIRIGKGVVSIHQAAFAQSSLETITFAEGSQIEGIGIGAFSDTKLTSITIPASIEIILPGAFLYCSSLTSVTVMATTPPTMEGILEFFDKCSETNEDVIIDGLVIKVPEGSVQAYKTHVCGHGHEHYDDYNDYYDFVDCNVGECGWSLYAENIVAIE